MVPLYHIGIFKQEASAKRRKIVLTERPKDEINLVNNRFASSFIVIALLVATSVGALANGDVARMRLNTAMRYVTMGWFAEATEHAHEAVNAAPEDLEANVFLALLQQASDQNLAALDQYERAISLSPELAVLAVFMGDIYLSTDRLVDAEAQYRRALEASPDLGLAYYGLGRTLQSQGDAEAIDVYSDGVQYAPDLPDLRFRLGQLLRRDGQYEEALEQLLHANVLNSQVAAVRYELGLTYEALADIPAAEHEYRTVLRLQPDHDLAKKRLSELSSL